MNRRHLLRSLLATGVAAAGWSATLPTLVRPRGLRDGLLAAALARWQGPRDDRILRASNPEWDLMARTFTVLALCDLALAEPERRAAHAAVLDRILEDTLQVVDSRGHEHYLLSYGAGGGWRGRPRSLFVDGELALMLGARRMLGGDRWAPEFREHAAVSRALMDAGPIGCGESYPDECWTFCNAAARVALALGEALDGTPADTAGWAARAIPALTEPTTGLLVSSFAYDGTVADGPEGSTVWMAATFLQPVLPALAADQYRRAREHLGRTALGFGWGREWPADGRIDVDSGPIVPLVEASAGSSGHAVVASRAFGDAAFHDALVASLGLAAFPTRQDDGLTFAAGNAVGDAVLLFATTVGPLWAAIQERVA
ncbi:MAG: hypothetical protein ACI8PZ_007437 [Myxococcota bacterium]|jgi:hypothetical protein